MNTRLVIASALLISSLFIGGCASNSSTVERYVSPTIQGEKQKINLDAVQEAFFSTSGKDFQTWMSAFEKRVNEIYEGDEVVAIDATRQSGKLVVTGYINTEKKEGYVKGDDKLFTIEQTGDAVDNKMPCRVADHNGNTYWEGQHSILDNPFLQMMIVSHMMNGWSGRYYTPYSQYSVLSGYRTNYRTSPQWTSQQSSNQGFFSRFKTNSSTGGLKSSSGFSTPFNSGSAVKNRSFSGISAPSATTTQIPTRSSGSSIWGGMRRSSSGFGSRSWGGMRRR